MATLIKVTHHNPEMGTFYINADRIIRIADGVQREILMDNSVAYCTKESAEEIIELINQANPPHPLRGRGFTRRKGYAPDNMIPVKDFLERWGVK